jgi:hypothetical protein
MKQAAILIHFNDIAPRLFSIIISASHIPL